MNTKGPLAMESEQLEQMKDQAEIDNILMTYKNRNYALEYAGTEDLEGMRAYILKLTKPNKSVSKIYIDPENYVVIKTVDNLIIQGVEKEIESYPSNYKYVDGVLFPFKYEQKIGGQIFMQINFESFELNTNPPDSLFIVPAMDMQKP
jgi:outer membrane lipoprotein-sorting protein